VLKDKLKITPFSFIFRISLFFILVLLFVSETSAYNRQAAVDYIKQFGEFPGNNEYNPDNEYYNFDIEDNPFGQAIGNCANAVSQALVAGGMDLSYGFYQGRILNPNGKYTFYGATQDTIGKYIESELRAVKSVMIGDTGSIPNLTKGDIVTLEYATGEPPSGIDIVRHVVMVEDVVNGVPILAGDNPPSRGDNFYDKFFGESSEYKFDSAAFYHFPTAEEAGQPVQVWGTGDFYGDEALAITIYEAGHNFLGWVLNNTNSSNQDMVIGEDTSDKQGCTYYIRGWCIDPDEGIPYSDDAFTQPWTSNDPEHWAYWMKQAVVYGIGYGYSDYDILDAVWYISNHSSGWYNEILTSIGYPPDGPQKPNEDLEAPVTLKKGLIVTSNEESDFEGDVKEKLKLLITNAEDLETATTELVDPSSDSALRVVVVTNGDNIYEIKVDGVAFEEKGKKWIFKEDKTKIKITPSKGKIEISEKGFDLFSKAKNPENPIKVIIYVGEHRYEKDYSGWKIKTTKKVVKAKAKNI